MKRRSDSNPVAPTIFSLGKIKANGAILSPNLSLDRVAQALANAAQALLDAANALRGESPPTGFAPVAHTLSLTAHTRGLVPTVGELVNEFLRVKARAGRSDRYLRQLRVSLGSFTVGRSRIPVDQVAAPDIERWLNQKSWSARTERGYLADVRTVFHFAIRRGYLERNPAAGVESPVDSAQPSQVIAVHTPDQVKAVLDFARRKNLDVCRHLAIRYFAGVRTAEAHRIRECDLKLDQGLLEVPALKSKTRSRRLVTIQPNLAAWLALGGELRAIGATTVREVILASKVPWAQNVARHSFVSYHLAAFRKINETALEAGHSEAMLFRHYRALVTPEAAAAYWAVKPGRRGDDEKERPIYHGPSSGRPINDSSA